MLEEEKVQPCEVCGKVWRRKDAKKWLYFRGMLVCADHPGAEKWYQGALQLMEESLKYLT